MGMCMMGGLVTGTGSDAGVRWQTAAKLLAIGTVQAGVQLFSTTYLPIYLRLRHLGLASPIGIETRALA